MSGNFDCISRLWRREKLVIALFVAPDVGQAHSTIDDVVLTLDHGDPSVNYRMFPT